MGNSSYVQVVNVQCIRQDGGYWVVSSDELPGLLLCGKVLKKLIEDVPNSIRLLFKLNYKMEVDIIAAADDPRMVGHHETDRQSMPKRWVAYSQLEECHV